jgi:molybdenum cofactor cytidylyltransferase
MTRVGAVILAAGESSRFRAGGGRDLTKLVAKLDGKPIVRRVVEAALAAKARPVVVVTGYARESVEAAIADLDVGIAFNSRFASGLSSSLGVGLSAMPGDVVGALVLLGDMPQVGAPRIDALIDAFLAFFWAESYSKGRCASQATRVRAGWSARSAPANWSKSRLPTGA